MLVEENWKTRKGEWTTKRSCKVDHKIGVDPQYR